jgi:O-antigen/teichoic acid export membrane protein
MLRFFRKFEPLVRFGFVRNVSVLAGSTLLSQALSVFASPIVTRLYSPNEFGLLGLYTSILSIIVVFAVLHYHSAIPLPQNERDALAIVLFSLMLLFLLTTILSLLMPFVADDICTLLDAPAFRSYIWLLPIGFMLSGAFQIVNYYSIRRGAFKSIAVANVNQAIVSVAAKVFFSRYGAFTLTVSYILSVSVGVVRLSRVLLEQNLLRIADLDFVELRTVAIRYKKFPLISTWSTLLNTTGAQLPILMFSTSFGPSVAGLYLLAYQVLMMPMALVGKAIGDVFFANAAEAKRNGTLGNLVQKTHSVLAEVGMPSAVMLSIVGPEFFALVFGDKWIQSGVFSRWLAPCIYLIFVTSPISTLYFVLERQGENLALQVSLLFARMIGIWVGGRMNDPLLSIALFSSLSSLCYFWSLLRLMKLSGVSVVETMQTIVRVFLSGAVIVSPLLICYAFEYQRNLRVWMLCLTLSMFFLTWAAYRRANSLISLN